MSTLKKYTNKRFSHLKKLLTKYALDQDPETLHGIRVEIKKLKVILQLVNEYVKGFHSHRHFVPLRNIFRQAGQIREPQIFYELLLRYEIASVKDSQIPGSANQAILSGKFQSEIPGYIRILKMRKEKLEKYLDKINPTQIRKYLKRKTKKLSDLLQHNLSGIALHKARKAVKEILYLGPITKNPNSSLNPFLDQIQELIGQWHDQQLLLEVLRKSKSPDADRLKLDRDGTLKEIRKIISDFNKQK